MTANYDAELAARFGDGTTLSGQLPQSPTLRHILLRRTHRRYSDRPLTPELLRLLLAAAFSASSKSDFQQASVVEVADPARRRAIAELVPDMPWIGTAPAFLLFCGDSRRLERLGEFCGHTVENGGLEGFFNAAVDAALALQTMVLAAEELGLGCCPISVVRNHADALAHILELPEKVFPVAGLTLGWPAQEGYISMRLPLAATLHRDRYDDAGLRQAIEDYDRRRDARHALPRDRQRRPEVFGYRDFYGWSEDKARQATEPEGRGFAAHLRRRGFSFE
ncbi:MAG TPA: nitroreductase family protein [Stellaceae bacterium]|nr:nitroreductase family protein [Stellaceae bacterium]